MYGMCRRAAKHLLSDKDNNKCCSDVLKCSLCLRSRSSACLLSLSVLLALSSRSDLLSWLWLTKALSHLLSLSLTPSNVALVLAKMHALSERIKREFRSVQSFVQCLFRCVYLCFKLLLFLLFLKGFKSLRLKVCVFVGFNR